MTHEKATAYLSKGRDKTRRPLKGRSSEMLSRPNGIAIKYHATDVVTLHPDGSATLQSGGYRTATTKERINEYSPARVHQAGGLWYMRDGSLFYDGITVDPDGKPLKPRPAAATEKRKRELDRLVSGYLRAVRNQIEQDRQVPAISLGDCIPCRMGPDNGHGCVDHILSHLRERYIHGSILWNALQGRGNPGFIWQWAGIEAAKGKALDSLIMALRAYLRNLKPALLEQMEHESR